MDDDELKTLESCTEKLQECAEKLKCVNDMLGYTKRTEDITKEIKLLGWEYCRIKYHPDNNMHDPAALPLFNLYKFVYDNLKAKGEIE
jgi:hypothetical protein